MASVGRTSAASVRKIVVDSRRGIGPSHAFTFDLPESVETGDSACLWVTDLSMFVAWSSVGPNNDAVFLVESVDGGEPTPRLVHIAQGQYTVLTLPQALQAALNSSGGAGYLVSYSENTNRLTIQNAGRLFTIVDEEHLRSIFMAYYPSNLEPWDPNNPQSANALLGIGSLPWDQWPPPLFPSLTTNDVVIGALNVVYLQSDTLAAERLTLTAKGRSSIIKTIPVASVYGTALTAGFGGLYEDAVPCGNQLFRRLDFRLTDYDGNLVQTHAPVSFSLCFGELR